MGEHIRVYAHGGVEGGGADHGVDSTLYLSRVQLHMGLGTHSCAATMSARKRPGGMMSNGDPELEACL